MRDPSQDQMERLLASMDSLDPPVDFLQHVLARAHAEAAAPRRQPGPLVVAYAAVYVLALVGLALLAYGLGLSIASSGASALISALAADLTLFADAPSAYLDAIVASTPWLHLAGVLIDLALVYFLTTLLMRQLGAGPARTEATES